MAATEVITFFISTFILTAYTSSWEKNCGQNALCMKDERHVYVFCMIQLDACCLMTRTSVSRKNFAGDIPYNHQFLDHVFPMLLNMPL